MNTSLVQWISGSLNRKFMVGTTVGLIAFSLLFLTLYLGMYRAQLHQQRASAAGQANSLLQTSLEAAMLRRDLEMLRVIVDQFGKQEGIRSVVIINRTGEVRFSNHTRYLNGPFSLDCQKCSFDPAITATPFSFFTADDQDQLVLRSVHPVANQPQCRECHGPVAENPVNGTLVVDYEASAIQRQASDTTFALMGAGAIVVLVNLAGGWWFIRRFVITPIQQLDNASQALADGDLDARVSLPGRDELAQLGKRFNKMAENLESSMLANRRKRTFLQGLVDADPDGIRVIDQHYRVILANRAYCQQLGLTPEQALNLTCYQATHGRDTPCTPTMVNCPLKTLDRESAPVKVLHQHTTLSGERIAAEVYAAPVDLSDEQTDSGELMIIESIRDLGQAMQISHEQKMSELGRLAAGVAHEIYNPLTSVRLALDSTARLGDGKQPQAQSRIRECMELVDREIDRCIEVTRRLLKMSMFTAAEKQIVSLNQAIDDTLSLLKWEAAEDGIETIQELDPVNPRIIANESDVRIAVLNLVQNAFHAMPDGGRLRVTSSCGDGRVRLCVEDTGVGIPLEDLHRIFDPFFSRRADHHQGTGLGLSITRALMERYQAHIEVDTRPSLGSRFTISFPDPDSAAEDAS